MVYRTRVPSHRSRRPRQPSDDELHSLEEGTSSGSSGSEREREDRRLVMHSEGKKRHGKFRRGLHKVHKRVRDAKGKGREVEVTRTQRMLCWGIFLLVLVGLGVWMWQSKSYVTVHDFVTFPTLTTPLDIMSIVDAATSAVASVATQVASGAVSVGTQIATGATSVAGEITEGAAQVTKAAEVTKIAEITKLGGIFGRAETAALVVGGGPKTALLGGAGRMTAAFARPTAGLWVEL